MKIPSPLFCLALVAAVPLLPAALRADETTDEQVRQILRQRVERDKHGVAIVVGLINEHGSRVVSFGTTTKGGGVPVDGKTIFEIGSITKVFTSLLLADMVAKGEVKLDDPVAKYLPKEVKVPTRKGKEITLLDLTTHFSGLPSMPTNLKSADPANPYADYTVAQMYAFLSGYTLTVDIGSKHEYSNLGVGLLGHALALRAGKSYEDLVVERVCQPLGMSDTRIVLTPEMHDRLAMPYDESLQPARNWDLPTLAGAGALRSDADDMLRFLAANLDVVKSPLSAALADTHTVRREVHERLMDIGLGWLVLKRYDPPLWWHNGGTGGYRSFIGFCPEKKTGVVVLSNSSIGVDDIGFHLLDDRYELAAPSKQRTAIKIEPETADRYVGKYEVIPQFALTFSREGERYFIDATGNPPDEVFPETETLFFSKSFDGQIEFVKDAQGKYVSLILHQGGMPDQSARRLP